MIKYLKILIFIIISGFFSIIYGQEMEKLGDYDNIINEPGYLGITMAVPFTVYQNGDTIINRSRNGEVKLTTEAGHNYRGSVIGGNWVDTLDIDSDSVILDFSHTDFDIFDRKMQINPENLSNTILGHFEFQDNGKKVFKLINVFGIDSLGEKHKYKNKYKKDKKLIYVFEKEKKIKKIDPEWSWQPDGSAGYDAAILNGSAAGTNYGASTDLYYGNFSGSAAPFRKFFVKFTLPTSDTLNITRIIDSAKVGIVYKLTSYPTPYDTIIVAPVKLNWVEGEVTYNDYAADQAWNTAGALGANDTWADSADTTYDISLSAGDTNYFDVTNSVRKMCGQDSSRINYGWVFSPFNYALLGAGEMYSSDWTTPAQRPELHVWYSTIYVPSGEKGGIIYRVDENGIKRRVDENGIKPKVNWK